MIEDLNIYENLFAMYERNKSNENKGCGSRTNSS
jgi:hypothetical protein